jgi:hypothetical protein
MRKARCKKVMPLLSLIRIAVLGIGLLLCCPPVVRGEESYTFDLAEIEKKPWHLGGYAEIRPVIYVLDKDAALYQLHSPGTLARISKCTESWPQSSAFGSKSWTPMEHLDQRLMVCSAVCLESVI